VACLSCIRRDQDSRLTTSVVSEFRLNDYVRLLDRHGDVASGSRGRVLGTFGGPADRSYIVSFEREGTCVAVGFDELVLAHDVRVSA
jgi:hypothetical protein